MDVTVSPGRSLAEAVTSAIVRLQGRDPLAEVLVVVPPGATASALRRTLPGVAGGIAGIRFLTPIDLMIELVDSKLATRRAITAQLQMAAVQSVLAGDSCPAELQPVRTHPATVTAVIDLAQRLRAAHHRPEALHALRTGGVRSAMVDVVIAARALLDAAGIRDESATIAAAEQVANDELDELKVVVAHTDVFHPAHLPFLDRLSDGPDAITIGYRLPDTPAEPAEVVSCPDPDEEVRYVVRRCAALLDGADEARVHADDIAIVCPAGQYRRPIRDELQRAGIAWTGAAVEQLAGSIAGQAVRAILDGMLEQWSRPAVFRLLSVAPLYPIGEAGRTRPVAAWTALTRRLGLVSGDDWTRAEATLAERQAAERQYRLRFGELEEWYVQREQRDASTLERLLVLVERLQRGARRLRRASTWAAAAAELAATLADHVGTPTWRERAWAEAPAWQRVAADQVERVVAGLAEMDHDGVAVPFSTAALRQAVLTLLDSPVRRRGEASGAVTIVDLADATCLAATHVFVVGVNEAVLPPPAMEDLVVQRELPALCADVIEAPTLYPERMMRAWQVLLAGDATVVATFARADLRRGGELYPSMLLTGLAVTVHHSHADGVLHQHPLTVAETLCHSATRRSPRLAARAGALLARQQLHPTEFDGIVGPHPGLAPQRWAATHLEHHAFCGLLSFGETVLGVREATDPAAITTIEPLERGNLVHGVFEHLAKEWLATDAERRPPWLRGAHLEAAKARAEELLDTLAESLADQHRLGHHSAWQAERAQIIRSVVATLERESAEGVQPVAAEHPFADVPVGDHLFTGKIDRIDVLPDGSLQITDYKTGNVAISADDPLQGGMRLQLPLYARAADHHAQELVGPRPAGVPPASARYLVVRDGKADAKQMPIDTDLMAAFEIAVATTIGHITAGEFPPRPHGADQHCPMCAPDALGADELAERALLFETDEA